MTETKIYCDHCKKLLHNMTDYIAAGASGVGVGSGIVNKEMIANNDFAGIAALAKAYTDKL